MADNHNPLVAGISRTALFRGLEPPLVELVAGCSRAVSFERGEMVFLEGDPCPGIYCVTSGLVRVYKTAPNGKEHILHFASPGMTFAEVAVLGDFACPAHAQASEVSQCVLVHRVQFQRLLAQNHQLSLQLLGGMARWVHHLIGLLEDLVLRDALSRVAASLLRAVPDGETGAVSFEAIQKKDLASHLNLTSETLSRTLRRLAELGTIDVTDQKRIVLLNLAKLQQIAEGQE